MTYTKIPINFYQPQFLEQPESIKLVCYGGCTEHLIFAFSWQKNNQYYAT